MRKREEKTDEELRKILEKGKKAHRALGTAIRKKNLELWRIRLGRRNLFETMYLYKLELGKRKSKACEAKKLKDEIHGFPFKHWTCLAKDLSSLYTTEADLLTKHCFECKWNIDEIRTRILAMSIKGRNGG